MPFIHAGGHRLEYEWVGPPHLPESPVLVFLHEGLGCVAMWRDFAAALGERTASAALLYSRWGHGGSERIETARPLRFMHDEALVTLPEVLAQLEVTHPILVGHSDGGSIALIYAGAHAGPVLGVILEAPHVFVERPMPGAMERVAGSGRAELVRRLARYHGGNAESMLRAWAGAWLSPEFAAWNIEEYLPAVTSPVLLIQGEQDEYGTVAQVERIQAGIGAQLETLLLPDSGHVPHREKREAVLEAMTHFTQCIVHSPLSP